MESDIRMWKLCLFVMTAFLPILSMQSAYSQQKIDIDWYCNYNGEELSDVYGFNSDKEADNAISRIVEQTGIVQNFVVRAANVPNAAATIVGQQRAILYNQEFMLRIKDMTRTDWAAISIMAHEIGHHLQGHTIQGGGSRPEIELEADRYSGFVLQRMGATLDQAHAAMNQLGSEQGSATHPPKSARLAAITNGWQAARDLRNNRPDTSIPPTSGPISQQAPVPSTTTSTPSVPQYVARCVFPSDPVSYFVTSTDDIVAVPPNGQIVLVGRKVPPSIPGFSWMYQTAYVMYGVGPDGKIYNRAPNGMPFQVGYVTSP